MKPRNSVIYALCAAFGVFAILALGAIDDLNKMLGYAALAMICFVSIFVYGMMVKLYRERLKKHYGYLVLGVLGVVITIVVLQFWN